jgi:hypothetical protein
MSELGEGFYGLSFPILFNTRHTEATHFITGEPEITETIVRSVLEWKFQRNPHVIPTRGNEFVSRSFGPRCLEKPLQKNYAHSHGKCYHNIHWESLTVEELDIKDGNKRTQVALANNISKNQPSLDCLIQGTAVVTINGFFNAYEESQVTIPNERNESNAKEYSELCLPKSCEGDPESWIQDMGWRAEGFIFKVYTRSKKLISERMTIPFDVVVDVKLDGEDFGQVKRRLNRYKDRIGGGAYYVLATEFALNEGTKLNLENECFYHYRLGKGFADYIAKKSQNVAEPHLMDTN